MISKKKLYPKIYTQIIHRYNILQIVSFEF